MKTKSLEILEKSQLPTVQARAILEVMELESATDQLATKADLQHLKEQLSDRIEKSELKQTARLKALEIRLVLWMFGMLGGFTTLIHSFLAHAR